MKKFAIICLFIYLAIIWVWAYRIEGVAVSVCVVLSLVALQTQLMGLAQGYMGELFTLLQKTFADHEQQINIIRNMLGIPKEQKNEKKAD